MTRKALPRRMEQCEDRLAHGCSSALDLGIPDVRLS